MRDHFLFPDLGNRWNWGCTPPPMPSTEIIDLVEISEIIYGTQSLAGKILSYKHLTDVPVPSAVPLSPWQSSAPFLLGARADVTELACGFLDQSLLGTNWRRGSWREDPTCVGSPVSSVQAPC